jgi:hypothetical protein
MLLGALDTYLESTLAIAAHVKKERPAADFAVLDHGTADIILEKDLEYFEAVGALNTDEVFHR